MMRQLQTSASGTLPAGRTRPQPDIHWKPRNRTFARTDFYQTPLNVAIILAIV